MLAQPEVTKWLVHSYEHCGLADVKRPMLEMLREGLNHHDRVPHKTHALLLSGWVMLVARPPCVAVWAASTTHPSRRRCGTSSIIT